MWQGRRSYIARQDTTRGSPAAASRLRNSRSVAAAARLWPREHLWLLAERNNNRCRDRRILIQPEMGQQRREGRIAGDVVGVSLSQQRRPWQFRMDRQRRLQARRYGHVRGVGTILDDDMRKNVSMRTDRRLTIRRWDRLKNLDPAGGRQLDAVRLRSHDRTVDGEERLVFSLCQERDQCGSWARAHTRTQPAAIPKSNNLDCRSLGRTAS